MAPDKHHSQTKSRCGGTVATEPRILFEADGVDPQTSFALTEPYARSGRVVVAISSDTIGMLTEESGVPGAEHGAELLRIFLETLCERSNLPDEVLLYGRGVFLAADGHPALPSIRLLCHREVLIKACSESLHFYEKKPAEPNVQPVPMSEITRIMMRADRVIRP
ncbi:MAG: hypothetical protein PHP22_05230 [Oscillospiraceae bacterium]|nr:hypothetical protein [Oscillospiraceae bacterium]